MSEIFEKKKKHEKEKKKKLIEKHTKKPLESVKMKNSKIGLRYVLSWPK